MQTLLTRDIREQLANYLSGLLKLDDFNAWLVEATWTSRPADRPAAELVGRVKLVLAEFSGGFLTEDELRDELYALLGTIIMDASAWGMAPPQAVSSGTLTSLIERPVTSLGPVFGVPLVGASGS